MVKTEKYFEYWKFFLEQNKNQLNIQREFLLYLSHFSVFTGIMLLCCRYEKKENAFIMEIQFYGILYNIISMVTGELRQLTLAKNNL